MAKRRPGTNSTSVWFKSFKHRLLGSLSGRRSSAHPTVQSQNFADIESVPPARLKRLVDSLIGRGVTDHTRPAGSAGSAGGGGVRRGHPSGGRRNRQSTWIQQFYRDSHLVAGFQSETLETRALLSSVSFWEGVDNVPSESGKSSFINASEYDAFRLDHAALDALLDTAPLESSGDSITLQLPDPEGGFQAFSVYESPIMAPELAAKFPEIRTFAGQGIDDPGANIRFDVTPAGLHASVHAPGHTWYVDPYYHLDNSYYAVYAGGLMELPDVHFHEEPMDSADDHARGGSSGRDSGNGHDHGDGADHGHDHGDGADHGHDHGSSAARGGTASRSGTELRTYRLAVAAAGEYTAFHGGTVASGQAAIVTAINRVNQVYENELSIRLELIGNNDQLVYTNAATDPYSSGIALLAENQTNVDNVIGNANYDVGHVFHTGGGGVATLNSVGVDGIKARGQTGLPNPVGDRFWIEYVGHELGHQFGGRHTFNGDSGSCASNRTGATAYEPGSGSTIQGYAGICGNDDLQPAADPYFHSISFDEIIAHVDGRIPTIGTRTATGNSVPTVDAGGDYTIPAQTPFILTATGTDADATDVLTFNWEQRDLGPQADVNAGDDGQGPLFRSWMPDTDPTRTFPRLSDLLNNTTVVGETLPTTTRVMNFRANVRDNRAGGGGVNSDDMVVNVVDTGSPFTVTSPNSAVSWLGTRVETVTWDVAGTTGNGIDTANVNIQLSTDGGFTWPFTLATNTPNDGNQAIIVPNVDTTEARIRVEGAGNVFFDVSNQNFSVTSVPTDVIIDDIVVNEGDGSAVFTVGLSGEAVDTVTLDLVATDGTAINGSDFTGATGQVVIPAGTSSTTFSVTLLNDSVPELPENFTLSVAAVVTGTVASSSDTGTATIIDNDASITVDVTATSVFEADGTAASTATVTRNTDNTAAMTVNLASSDTSELTVPATVTIPAGQDSVSFNVDAVADNFVDGDQTVNVVPTVFGHVPIGDSVQVRDSDTPTLSLVIAADFINENDGAAATTAIVTRNTDPSAALVVNLMSSDTAEATVVSSVTIPAGQLSSAPFDIDAVDESVFDGTKVVTITASAAGFADGTDTVDVLDDETPVVSISIDSTSIAEDGGVANVTATSSFAAPAEITIELQLSGTATGGGVDYNAPTTTLTIPAGATTATAPVTITALDDGTDEVDETVIVGVTSVTNATLDRNFQDITATIVDGNPPPTVTIVPTSLTATEGDTLIYEIQLSAASTLDVTVNLAIGGSATGGGVDFNTPGLQVVIPASQVSATVTVPTIDDAIDEATETVILGTTTIINGLAANPPQASIDLLDNDAAPTVQLGVDAGSIPEDFGQAVFTATLSEVSGQDVTVDLATSGTATAGVDFTITATQLVIPAGSLSASTTLSASPDVLDEFDETAIVQITSATNASIGLTDSAQTIIRDDDNAPTVSLSNSSSTVSEGAGSFDFFATLDAISGKDVTVNLLLRGDAVVGTDYTSSPNAPIQLIIPAGSLSASVNITVIDDALDEFDELVILEFDSVVNAVENIVQQSAVTILDNDAAPELTLSLAPTSLGESSGSNALLTASLSAVSGKDVTVNLATSGNASAADYSMSATTLVIPSGSLSSTITITPIDDTLSELDETLTLDVGSSSNVNASTATAQTLTILDDEAEPTVALSIDNSTIAETGGVAIVTATLSEISGQDVTVAIDLTGLASVGIDYAPSSNQIVIPEGAPSATLTLTALSDLLDEFDEDIIATAGATVGAIVDSAANQVNTIIQDDDAAPTVDAAAAAASIDESDAAVVFDVTLTAPSGRDITVDFALSGTATAGADYVTVASPLVIAAGQTSATISLAVNDDLLHEFDEDVVLNLISADFAALGTTQATTTINDNDTAPVVTLSLADATIAEAGGTTTLTAALSAVSGRDVSIDLSLGGTATAGTDYTSPGATLSIPAGQASIAVPITAIDDPWVESPDEVFSISIASLVNASWDGSSVTAQITDDDVPTLTISINPTTVNEADGAAAATATISRNTTVSRELTVNLASSDVGEATVPSTATIPFGQMSTTINIAAINDLILDGTQTVTITAASAGFVDGTATLDVEDATTTVDLELSASSVDEGSGATVTITARTAKPVIGDQTLDLTISGTGITASDYSLSAVTLTIPDGQTTATATISAVDDAVVELSETASIGVTSLTNGLAPGSAATQDLLIVNDDTAILNIDDVSQDEGNSGTTIYTFTVTLDRAVDSSVSVSYQTANETATTSNADYAAGSGQLTFAGLTGETQTITIDVAGDLTVEADETFVVNLLSIGASGRDVVLGDATGTATIVNDDVARISIGDVTIAEDDSANPIALFPVTVDADIAVPITIDFATVGGTANAGTDFVAASGTLTFAGGTGGPQTLTIPVTVLSDSIVELDEQFTVQLSNLQAASQDVLVDDAEAAGVITNDDAAQLTITNAALAEGDSGSSTATFTVMLDNNVDVPLSVDYSTANVTATTADGDYQGAGGTLNFTGFAGQSIQVDVTVNGDLKLELDETFDLLLSNLQASGRNVSASGFGTATIANDDSASLSISDVTVIEGDNGSTSAFLTVTLTGEVDEFVSVDYTTADGSALSADADYTSSSGTVTFLPNQPGPQTRSIEVQVTGDEKVELNEHIFVDLTAVDAAGRAVVVADAQGQVAVDNDDSAQITIDNVAVAEGDGTGTSLMTFTVQLDAEVDGAVAIAYDTADGSATASDYVSASGGIVLFAANAGGPQTQTIQIEINADDVVERDETLLVNLSGLVAGGRAVTVLDSQGVGTITNDDAARIQISDHVEVEGDSGIGSSVLRVTLLGEVDTDVSISATAVDDTASLADGDYVDLGVPALTFAAHSGAVAEQTIDIQWRGDGKVELNERFFVDLFNLSAAGRNVSIEDGRGQVTLTNDDSAVISISDAVMTEGTGGTTQFDFTLTLDNEVDAGIDVVWSTADGVATAADNDFQPVSGQTVSFAANVPGGPQQQTVSVQVTADAKVELEESFSVLLDSIVASGRSVSLGASSATGTILNDDSATISISDATISEADSGNSDITFDVILSHEVDVDLAVDFQTAEGTATLLDSDFVQRSGTINFTANAGSGSQTQTITVQVAGDRIVELDETFFVDLQLQFTGRAVTVADGQGQATIQNNDVAVLSVDDVTISEGDLGVQQLLFTVTLDSDVDQGFTVDAQTTGSEATPAATATANSDFTPTGTSLVFNGVAGESYDVAVNISGDQTVELNENFFLTLSNLVASGRSITLDSPAEATLINDDAASISISDATIVEGNSGTQQIVFELTLDQAVDVPVTVGYSTQNGTATAGLDYQQASGNVTFSGSANEMQAISIDVLSEILVESDEQFLVNLLSTAAAGRNVSLLDSSAVGSILNDDQVSISISDVSVREGFRSNGRFAIFEVTRSNNTVPVAVSFATDDGTATLADNDYRAHAGILNLPAGGPMTANVAVEIVGDHRLESNEFFTVDIQSDSFGAVITDDSAVGTIVQDDGFISGQKFHDRNGNGLRDPNEPGLNGWTIEVVDPATGLVVATVLTADIDVNNDGTIDPQTEQGRFRVGVNDGDWEVREVLQPGWRQTQPNGGDALAWQLDQTYNLRRTGSLFVNWGGLNEKWMFGNDGWYFITPAGNLFRWNGSPTTNLSGQFVGKPGPKFHATPSLLHNAQPPGGSTIAVAAGDTTEQNFGNVPTGSIEGRKYFDVNADGRRDSTEPWLNGWGISLVNSAGNVVATTTTMDIDINGDGIIHPQTERGVYRFTNVVPGQYTVVEDLADNPLWRQSGSTGAFADTAFLLNQRLHFRRPQNDFLNWGGRNEKWLWTNSGWHFITPDGSIYDWDDSPRTNLTGELVTRLNNDYWANLSLLHAAASPTLYTVQMTGQEVVGLHFSNTFAHDGQGSGRISVTSDLGVTTISGDDAANNIVIYAGQDGQTMIRAVGASSINGAAPVMVLPTDQLHINLAGGDDQLSVVGVDLTHITVESAGGNDRLTFDNVTSTDVRLLNGGGQDEFRWHHSTADSFQYHGAGGGLLSLQSSQINGNVTIESGDVGLTVLAQQTTVSGAAVVQTGRGHDRLIANRSTFGSSLSVDTDGGDDLLILRATQVAAALDVEGRAGNDTVGVSHGSSVGGSVVVRGGSGTDLLANDGTVAALPASGFESGSGSDLDGLIDDVLSEFDQLHLLE